MKGFDQLRKQGTGISRTILCLAVVLILLAAKNDLPRLFLVGDSISIQYTPYLKDYLQEMVVFARKEDDGAAKEDLDVPTGANGGDSRMVLEYLRSKMEEPGFTPDFLLLNCGLHDIKRDVTTGKAQVSETEYKENLEAIVSVVRQKNIQLIWIRSTPVVDSIHNSRSKAFHRFASDLEAYNRIADDVFEKARIPIIDLYRFTQSLGIAQIADHVHYRESARALQAAYISGFLQNYLSGRAVRMKGK